jgi:hypothetical protein
LRAAFFCCFSFRAQAFCRFLNVSIISSSVRVYLKTKNGPEGNPPL